MSSVRKDKYYYSDGTTSSGYNHNKTLHRVDGPAYEGADGSRSWWVDGKLHRVDGGPAVEWADGTRSWYVDGKRLSEKQFEKHPARLRYLIEKSIEEELQETS
jgi:hypothetical protein